MKDLIVEGLTDRWGAYDATVNPDLESFPEAFKDDLILVADQANEPVAVGILRCTRPCEAEILRMSVRRNLRGSGIGSRILAELLAAAAKMGIKTIRLETTATWLSAVSFYEKHGFHRTHLRAGDQHFALELSGTQPFTIERTVAGKPTLAAHVER